MTTIRRVRFRTLAAVGFALAWNAAVLPAADPKPPTIAANRIAVAHRYFEQAKASAKSKAVRQISVLMQQAGQSSDLSTSARRSAIASLQSIRDELARNGTWATDSRLDPIRVEYAINLAKAYKPLVNAYLDAIDSAAKQRQADVAKQWHAELTELDATFPGRDELSSGTSWSGTRTQGRYTSPITFTVEKVAGNTILGRIDENPSFTTHPTYLVRGELIGNHIRFSVTRIVQGTTKLTGFDGVLLGDGKMVLSFVSVYGSGRAYGGHVRLDKQ